MEVIKKGNKPNWTRIQACYCCKAEIKLDLNDLLDRTVDNVAEHWYFNCPECGANNQIKTWIPPEVSSYVLKNRKPKNNGFIY